MIEDQPSEFWSELLALVTKYWSELVSFIVGIFI